MNKWTSCPKCGAVLPPDAPKGLCPACLVRVGAGWNQVDGRLAGAQDAESSTMGVVCPMIFGGYELLEEIGRGGMGVVYRARQVTLNRPVALKMLLHGRFSDPTFIQRFHTEAEAAAQLEHPHIVPIHDVGQHAGQPYYTMKLVEGESLDQVLSRGPLPPETAARLMITLAEAVSFAHQRGVLHRDIKPHNVLLDLQGEPHLTDFGVAKLLNGEGSVTLSEALVGSPGFMAPEQASGKARHVTTAADVYGLGAVLYALLTARPVFQAETPLQTVRQVLEQDPVRPRIINPAIVRDLETICLKCLAKEPARRYPSPQALADDLARWVRGEPIEARRTGSSERLWLWCRRQPVRAGLTGTLLLVFVLGLAGIFWQWRRAVAGELLARQTAYAAEMNLAQRALVNNEFSRAISLLEKYRPTDQSGVDLRDWEWRYLWQLCQDDEHSLLHCYTSEVNSVSISSDGKLLALAKGAGVALWDLATQLPMAELPDTASTLAFSPTENLLAVATRDGADRRVVRLWDTHSRRVRATLTTEFPVLHLAFSPDGKLLATSDEEGRVRVTEWASKHLLIQKQMLPIRRPQAGRLVFCPDGRRLAIGGDIGELWLLDWRSDTVVKLEAGTSDGVTALAISPSGNLLAAGFGYTDGTIGLWDLGTGKPWGKLTNHAAYVVALAFTPDGKRLLSGSEDGTIRVWDLSGRAEVKCFQAHQHGVTAFALLADGKTLVSGAPDGAVCLWDCSAPVPSRGPGKLVISAGLQSMAGATPGDYGRGAPKPKVIRRSGVAFEPDSRSFITTDTNGALAVYDARSMKVVKPLPELGTNNWGVALSPDCRCLAAGNASGKITVWDWKTRQPLTNLVMPFQWTSRIRFSRTGRFLVASSTANNFRAEIRIWATNNWAEIPAGCIHWPTLLAADLSPDDRLLAIASYDGSVQVSAFPSGQSVDSFRTIQGYNAIRFSPDSRLLVLGRADGPMTLWNVSHGREVGTLPGHFLTTWGITFSADGCRLLTGGRTPRDAVKLWDTVTQSELLVLPVLPAEGQIFYDVGFSPDGNTLFANSLGGVAHFWRAPSWAEIEVAEKREGAPR